MDETDPLGLTVVDSMVSSAADIYITKNNLGDLLCHTQQNKFGFQQKTKRVIHVKFGIPRIRRYSVD